MMCHNGKSRLSPTSLKIKLLLVLIVLTGETTLVYTSEDGQNEHSEATGEIAEEIGNPTFTDPGETLHAFHLLPNQNEEDVVEGKRHVGAVAALSGSRSLSGRQPFSSPLKKHMASVAAGKSMGKKLDPIVPSAQGDMYKRHLGALKSLSGAKLRPLTRSFKEPSGGYKMGFQDGTFDLGLSPVDYIAESPDSSIRSSPDDADVINSDEIRTPSELLYDIYSKQFEPRSESWYSQVGFESVPSVYDEFQGGDLPRNGVTVKDELQDQKDIGMDDVRAYKSKRFLGPLARGGWFPRHFRGVISDSSFGKRHIGALARLGWMPHAKATSRLPDEQLGDSGLKRNDASPRRRMLYHFTAPSLWTGPRAK